MIDVEWVRKTERDYPGIIKDSARKFMPIAGRAVLAQAKLLVPVDTGNLRSSLTDRVEENQAIVGTNVEYAEHIEYGTVRLPTRTREGYVGYKPYLRPAIDLLRERLIKSFAQLVGKEISGRN